MNNAVKINIAGRVCRRYLEEIEPGYLSHFEFKWRSLSKLESIDAIIECLLEPVQKVVPKDSLSRTYDYSQFNLIIANINKVTGHLLEEVSAHEGFFGRARMTLLLDTSIRKSGTPKWLQTRLRESFLPLFIDESVRAGLIDDSQFIEKPFIIYLNASQFLEGHENDATKYLQMAKDGKFDIFIDDIFQPEIIVRQQRNAFQMGNKLPTRILCYLLRNVGHDVSFSDIRNAAMVEQQNLSTSKSNEMIRKSLAYIQARLKKMKGVKTAEPAVWFQRMKATNVHVWKKLNSCLISSTET